MYIYTHIYIQIILVFSMLNSKILKINKNGDYKSKDERRYNVTEGSCKGEWGVFKGTRVWDIFFPLQKKTHTFTVMQKKNEEKGLRIGGRLKISLGMIFFLTYVIPSIFSSKVEESMQMRCGWWCSAILEESDKVPQ